MGAIFFYIFIYFLGYYGSSILNMLTVKPLVTNRYIAALLPVYGIALAHAYMIVSKPLPQGKDVTVESALLQFVVLPVIVVTMGAIYFMWNSKGGQEDAAADTPRGNEECAETAATPADESKTESQLETSRSPSEESSGNAADINARKDGKES